MVRHSEAKMCYLRTAGKRPCLNHIKGNSKCELWRTCTLTRKEKLDKPFVFKFKGKTYTFYSFAEVQASLIWKKSAEFRRKTKSYYNIDC